MSFGFKIEEIFYFQRDMGGEKEGRRGGWSLFSRFQLSPTLQTAVLALTRIWKVKFFLLRRFETEQQNSFNPKRPWENAADRLN